MAERHVLGISGGKDSAALACFMRLRHPEIDVQYFFTDTGKELPEVYEFLGKLEGFLGKPILRLNPDRDFDFWLREYGHFLPSPRTRWCTRQLKLLPFRNWIKPWLDAGDVVHSYVAIRADETHREGYESGHENLTVHLPFREAGIDHAGVIELLQGAGIGLPRYYEWRSRSGCTFCFFQQKIEWVRLRREHPLAFEEAKSYEKSALEHGSPFTWSQNESLSDLEKPERMQQIEIEHTKRLERLRMRQRPNPLRSGDGGSLAGLEFDDEFSSSKACLICHK
jgi:3'-phosphoadenosine 5'-phosphosulfate sulfotransferase (PAPS reductase)/FAD synthetase